MRLIPSCREVSELLSKAQERPLNWRERFAVRVHLPLCEACRNFRTQLVFMRAAMRAYLDRKDSAR